MTRKGRIGMALAFAVAALTACSSVPGTQASVHPAQAGEPALAQVQGHAYQDMSADDIQIKFGVGSAMEFAEQINTAADMKLFDAASAHFVTPSGSGDVELFEFRFTPKYANDSDTQTTVVNFMIGEFSGPMGSGNGVTKERIINHIRVVEYTDGSGSDEQRVDAWVHDGIFCLAFSRGASSQLEDFLTKQPA